MPNGFHRLQFYTAVVIAVVSLSLYAFVPKDRADFIGVVATSAVGFIFGKFTNGFKGGKDA